MAEATLEDRGNELIVVIRVENIHAVRPIRESCRSGKFQFEHVECENNTTETG